MKKTKVLTTALASLLLVTNLSTTALALSDNNRTLAPKNPINRSVTKPIDGSYYEVDRKYHTFHNKSDKAIMSAVEQLGIWFLPGKYLKGAKKVITTGFGLYAADRMEIIESIPDVVYLESIKYEGRGADGNQYVSIYMNYYSDSNFENIISSDWYTVRK
ncbi:hypothetical protein [Oceanirhabdus seepicola]|uniref:Secreted protein n=1 Tax=Oceanirhabdus seepicola TaxID=2828781 RepID=A0A9J6P7D9_9CLOT|nr:hypothetical protein [Oceanirhabdus seepicola]MCM1992539.1 hypothetical protein [Oceanirhabdus seepicola]